METLPQQPTPLHFATPQEQAVGTVVRSSDSTAPRETTHAAAPASPTTLRRVNTWLENLSGVSLTDKTVFTQNLYIMIKSGIPLAESLGTLALQTRNKHLMRLIGDMKSRVEKGEPFAKALEAHAKYFSEVYRSMIAAGEAGGRLETMLHQLAKQMKKERVLIGKVRGAMFYPAIVSLSMVVIGIAMMVFVIPRISSIYVDTGATLPLPTRVLIAISNFVVHNGLLVAGTAIAFIIGFARLVRTKHGKWAFHGVLLWLPIVGTIIKKVSLARFARTLHSLLQTDIPIVQAFQIIERTLGNVQYRAAMEEAAQSLKKGVAVVESLRVRPKLFPPLVTQMISVGEESGKLDELAEEIAMFYEEDVDETMTNFSSVIEPVLILLLGIGVAGMAIAILLPIYSLTQNV